MIGQHFDNIWIYAKAVTDKYDADNRLDYGISKDLVGEALRSFGVKLYSSNFSVASLSSLLLGEWYDSGSEQITSFVTASNSPTPDQDIIQETYKRLYHNLPYLIKTKGTERGLRALINCFGIPSGSLQIREFGGVAKVNTPYFTVETGSVDKIRLNNTGSVVPGNTLSQYVSIQNPEADYTQDAHTVEVGFSPTYYIDKYIAGNITGSFNIDDYIGDPRTAHDSSYTALQPFISSSLGNLSRYDMFDFIRLIKFFDNQVFKMVKDFVPVRASATTGIIIKPHLLERGKIKQPALSLTQPEYSASIDTAFLEAQDGGVIDHLSTAYTASVVGALGTIQQIQSTEVQKYNGELGGTVLDLYTGSLNSINTYLQVSDPELRYDSTGSATNIYPLAGGYTWKYITAGASTNRTFYVDTVYINVTEKNGLVIDKALTRLNPGDTIKYRVSGSRTDGNFPPVTTQVLKSFTGTVAGKISFNNPIGQKIWALQLERTNVVITGFDSLLETFSYGSVANVNVVVEPFLNNPTNFYKSINQKQFSSKYFIQL